MTPRFLEIKQKYDFYAIQIVLEADGETLLERFKQRSASRERHAGHVDATSLDEYRARLEQGAYQPLEIGGSVIRINTNDFVLVQYDALLKEIQSLISNL